MANQYGHVNVLSFVVAWMVFEPSSREAGSLAGTSSGELGRFVERVATEHVIADGGQLEHAANALVPADVEDEPATVAAHPPVFLEKHAQNGRVDELRSRQRDDDTMTARDLLGDAGSDLVRSREVVLADEIQDRDPVVVHEADRRRRLVASPAG
jgi:hypothetical protein